MHPAWTALLVGHGLVRPRPSSRLARRAPRRPLAWGLVVPVGVAAVAAVVITAAPGVDASRLGCVPAVDSKARIEVRRRALRTRIPTQRTARSMARDATTRGVDTMAAPERLPVPHQNAKSIREQRRTLGGGREPRPQRPGRVRLLRGDDRRLLPSGLPGPTAAARARALPRLPRGRRARRLKAMSAVPSQRAIARGTPCGSGGGCVSSHPYGGGVAGSRRPRWSCRHEPVPLPPHIQGRHRLHAAGVRRRPSTPRPGCATRCVRPKRSPTPSTTPGSTRTAGSTRLLRRSSGWLPRRSCAVARARRSCLPSASARSARYWRQRPQRGCARSCSATIRMPWCTSWRTVSHGRSSSRESRNSNPWWPVS